MKKRLALLLAFVAVGCVTTDPRTPAELQRDADAWARAIAVRVTLNPEQVRGCASLGLVAEGSGVWTDPKRRPPPGATFEEDVLRYKTARLGGNAALAVSEVSRETRIVGEAYLCSPVP